MNLTGEYCILGGVSEGKSIIGSSNILVSKSKYKFIINNLSKWKSGILYRHIDDWFVLVTDNQYFIDSKFTISGICFNCGSSITDDDLYLYDELKNPNKFKYERPYLLFGETICRECEFNLRSNKLINA